MAGTLRFAPLQVREGDPDGKDRCAKLELYHLSEESVPLYGYCSVSRRPQQQSFLALDRTSFDGTSERRGSYKIEGEVYVLNSAENFHHFDRKSAVDKSVARLRRSVREGKVYAQDTSVFLLQRFVLLVYPDLKNYEYLYWFCFPVITPLEPFTAAPPEILDAAAEKPDQVEPEWLDLSEALQQFCGALDAWLSHQERFAGPVFSTSWPCPSFDVPKEITDLKGEGRMLCFLDPYHSPQHPSWLLRNILACLCLSTQGPFKVLCLRERNGKIDAAQSSLFTVHLASAALEDMGFVSGWESTGLGHCSRQVQLKRHFDPRTLADEANGLNLRLMLWRAAPDLNLDILTQTRCLLIGMGTLGCHVARCLLGWGVRSLSLVDSGRVSFSNPVRQCLYEFEDCLEGGRFKADCAAEHLRRIHPTATIQSYTLCVPMPGHPPVTSDDQASMQHVMPISLQEGRDGMFVQAAEQLHALVEGHDVIFLLTDNRESRWLPSVMAAALHRIVLCVALGYESYLIMRHGLQSSDPSHPPRLSCYFCHDIQAPTDTTRRLALDQQCTVARPGLAPIASALAVELLISLLHHPLQARASHAMPVEGEEGSVLGGIPHMMKGSVFHFSNSTAYGPAFNQCTACSDAVTSAYLQDRWDFVLPALRDEKFLQDLTGLTALLEKAEALVVCEGSEGDSEYELV